MPRREPPGSPSGRTPSVAASDPGAVASLRSVTVPRPWVDRGARFVGFALLVPVALLYAASGLVVPQPWLTGLWALGLAIVVYAVLHRHDAWRVLGAPVAAVVAWVVIITLGDVVLGWTA